MMVIVYVIGWFKLKLSVSGSYLVWIIVIMVE